MTATHYTSEPDPQVAAKALARTGEKIVSNRGWTGGLVPVGPSCSIVAADGTVRLTVISDRTGSGRGKRAD